MLRDNLFMLSHYLILLSFLLNRMSAVSFVSLERNNCTELERAESSAYIIQVNNFLACGRSLIYFKKNRTLRHVCSGIHYVRKNSFMI